MSKESLISDMAQIRELSSKLNEIISEKSLYQDVVQRAQVFQEINLFIENKTYFKNTLSKKNNTCDLCEYWTEHKRKGSCSQMGKWNNQITFHDYGCTTWEKKETKC